MTLAYSCDFLLIIVALSKINNTIQQDFNWTGCNTELEEILKGSRIHDSKWKQAEGARSSCTMSLHSNNKNLLYNNTTDLWYGKPLPHYLFSSLCLSWLKKPCLSPFISFPSFSIPHASHLAFTFRFTAAFADVPFTYQIVFIMGSNLPAFSWVWLRKCRNSLQNKSKDPRMKRMSFLPALSLLFFFSLSPYFLTSK